MADPVEEAAERLYGLPLDEFIRERNATAKALRADKERDAAKAVAALTKPSAGAWAVNAIARTQPDLRDELLAAGDAVRDAQEEAVSGGGAGALREATTRQRQAIDAVLTAAAELEPGGRKLSRTILDRLRGTLQAAAGDESVREAIASGRLVREAEGGGAWPFGGDDDEPPAPKPKPKPRTKPARDEDAERREREERERRKELESQLAEARAERRARERELARAERHAERAAKRLEEAQAALADARDEAEEAQTELKAARDAADEARDHAARIEEQLD